MNFSNIKEWTIPEGAVNKVTDSLGRVIWEKQGGRDYSQDYFFVEDISGAANTLSIGKNVGNSTPTIRVYKSTDQINWTYVGQTSRTALTLTIPANSKVYLKATTNSWAVAGANNNNVISGSGGFNVGGNIMSLIAGDNFRNATLVDGTNDYAFSSIFNHQYVIDASNLVFPNTVANRCYEEMFASTYLVNPPAVLPATTLAKYCYYGMFQSCTSLATAPALPATTLTQYCYQSMFQDCTSLASTPTLPATTLADYCYRLMFKGCHSLTTAPATLPATTLTQYCYQSMFDCCTSLATAPELPAATLASNCYYNMFYGCSNLSTVTTYANNISATNCLHNWLNGVAAQGDFYNLGSATYTSSASGIPTGWTEHKTL